MARIVTYKRRTQTGKISTVRRRVKGNGNGSQRTNPTPSLPNSPDSTQVWKDIANFKRGVKMAGNAVVSYTRGYRATGKKRRGTKIVGMSQSVIYTGNKVVRSKTRYKTAGGATLRRIPQGMRLSTRHEPSGFGGLGRTPVTRMIKTPPKR